MNEYIVPVTNEDFVKNDLKLRQLIRCKECKYGEQINNGFMIMCHNPRDVKAVMRDLDWFCADGMKKESSFTEYLDEIGVRNR